ncbi:MAG TPA: nicotinate dehydrogenase medium molybdopterin subunit, partial [Candidatus Sumerlaeota bacterium]|nr:nicotinate dehydrogenase medium molybdopterin subunit [Candidatus Sumerlaeota bacterium]
FINYKIAGPVDIPEIVPVLDIRDTDTGARSIGEPTTIPTAGAIANAVANALGVRVRHLPITPRRVLEAMQEQKGKTA